MVNLRMGGGLFASPVALGFAETRSGLLKGTPNRRKGVHLLIKTGNCGGGGAVQLGDCEHVVFLLNATSISFLFGLSPLF